MHKHHPHYSNLRINRRRHTNRATASPPMIALVLSAARIAPVPLAHQRITAGTIHPIRAWRWRRWEGLILQLVKLQLLFTDNTLHATFTAQTHHGRQRRYGAWQPAYRHSFEPIEALVLNGEIRGSISLIIPSQLSFSGRHVNAACCWCRVANDAEAGLIHERQRRNAQVTRHSTDSRGQSREYSDE